MGNTEGSVAGTWCIIGATLREWSHVRANPIPYRGAAGGSNFGAKSGEGSGKFARPRTKGNKFLRPGPGRGEESWHGRRMVEKSNVANIPKVSRTNHYVTRKYNPSYNTLQIFFSIDIFFTKSDTMERYVSRDVTLCASGWSIFSNRELEFVSYTILYSLYRFPDTKSIILFVLKLAKNCYFFFFKAEIEIIETRDSL